jgi:hypothetical protein
MFPQEKRRETVLLRAVVAARRGREARMEATLPHVAVAGRMHLVKREPYPKGLLWLLRLLALVLQGVLSAAAL